MPEQKCLLPSTSNTTNSQGEALAVQKGSPRFCGPSWSLQMTRATDQCFTRVHWCAPPLEAHSTSFASTSSLRATARTSTRGWSERLDGQEAITYHLAPRRINFAIAWISTDPGKKRHGNSLGCLTPKMAASIVSIVHCGCTLVLNRARSATTSESHKRE